MSTSAPQTKSEIVRMLRATSFRPARRRGQSFLIDGNLMRLAVQAAELTPDDFVLEVGTGTGSLTGLLAEGAGEVLTVEVDRVLVDVAREALHALSNVTLVHADVLAGKHQINPEVLRQLEAGAKRRPRTKLVANLPYSVAAPLLLNLMFADVTFERMVFTVQREFAERLAAAPGTREYGWITVVAATAGEVRILRQLPREAFWPVPEVESSLVEFRPRRDWKKGLDVGRLRNFGTFVFQQRRKTVLRIVREYVKRAGSTLDPAALLDAADIDPKTRGDQLTPRDVIHLSRNVT